MKKPKAINNLIKFNYGLVFVLAGWLIVFYDPFVLFQVLLSFWVFVFWFIGLYQLSTSLLLYPYKKQVKHTKILLTWMPLALVVFSLINGSLIEEVFFLFIFLLLCKPFLSKASNEIRYKTTVANTVSEPVMKIKHHQTMTINNDAYYLNMLLANPFKQLLVNLLQALNALVGHLPYLEKNHNYLATKVKELIADIQQNTICRLEKTAKSIANNGEITASAKQAFATTHERNIVGVLQEHLTELNDLNDSILATKMANFENINDTAESKFRDALMELKILLKWQVAQNHDGDIITKHEVILKKLEKTTLKHMQDLFFKPTTTNSQKQSLQTQIEDLLTHFKSELNPVDFADESSEAMDTVLKLEYQPNIPTPNQVVSDEFIQFNAEYIKQLKKHW